MPFSAGVASYIASMRGAGPWAMRRAFSPSFAPARALARSVPRALRRRELCGCREQPLQQRAAASADDDDARHVGPLVVYRRVPPQVVDQLEETVLRAADDHVASPINGLLERPHVAS